LCSLVGASLADLVASYKPKDEQRRFQLEVAALALRDGMAGLARRWPQVGSAAQRQNLLAEIAQYWNEWAGDGAVELVVAALDERDDKVRGYALLCAKLAVESQWMTPGRRKRIAHALVQAMARHDARPLGLFWLEKYVELLGLLGDASVLERLEKLRPFSGASRRTFTEKLDPENLPLPWPKSASDIPPGVPVPVAMVSDVGTGLLEIKVLEAALQRIRSRH
jgi:hypothetical protein